MTETPKLICHDVLQCTRFSKLQRKCRVRTADDAVKSFTKTMEHFHDKHVTLLCLGEGTLNTDWVEAIRPHLVNWDIQTHGMTHIRYDKLNYSEVMSQLYESKCRLEETFNKPVTVFYPPFRKFKTVTRVPALKAGLSIDSKHRHPPTELQSWSRSKRVDFHYWYPRDIRLTRGILKAREMKLTYILGAPRSGTTAYMRYLKSQIPDAVTLKEVEKIWSGNNARVTLYYTDRLFKSGKSHIIDKNVRNTLRLNRIMRTFPDAEYIFIYRDPRAAISSWRDWSIKTHKKDTSIEGAAKQYLEYIQCWLDKRAKLPNIKEERYEDLCSTVDYFKSRDYKWKKRLTSSDAKTIYNIVKPILGKTGYG